MDHMAKHKWLIHGTKHRKDNHYTAWKALQIILWNVNQIWTGKQV